MNRAEHDLEIERIGQADRRFFAHNPHRTHVLRRAFQIEVKDAQEAGMKPKDDEGIFVIVKMHNLDLFNRAFFRLADDTDPASWSEKEARGLYEERRRQYPNLRKADADLRALAEEAALYASKAGGQL